MTSTSMTAAVFENSNVLANYQAMWCIRSLVTGHGPFCAPAIEIRSSPSDSPPGEANRRWKRLFRHHSIDGRAA